MNPTAAARYFDGRSGAEHPVTLRWEQADLAIEDAAGERTRWPLDQVRASQPDPDGVVSLWCTGGAGRVLVHRTALPSGLLKHERRSYRPKAWLALTVAAFAVIVAVIRAPGLGAVLVPGSVQNQLGAMTLAALTELGPVCSGAEGQRALDRLESRLAHAARIPEPVQIVVLDDSLVNALALPGSRIVVMKGLIDQAQSANELAGVMAHETAHIASRDPVNEMVRRYGIRMMAALFGLDIGFGNLSSMAGNLASLSYSRDTERTADMHAAEYLHAAGLRSDGLAVFFRRLQAREGQTGVPDFLSDHPRTKERAAWSAGTPNGADALTEAQWRAVRAMCKSPGGASGRPAH